MSDKDEIKELFRKELGNYEAKVDSNLWNGIQSGLTGASAAGGSPAGISVMAKSIITVLVATVATLSAVVIFTDEEPTQKKKVVNINTDSTDNTTDLDKEDSEIREEIKDPVDDYKKVDSTFENSEEAKTEIVEIEQIETPEIKSTEVVSDPKEKMPLTENDSTKSEEKIEEEDKIKPAKKDITAQLSIVEQDNQYVKFEAMVENANRIEWSFGDGKTSDEFSPEYFYEEAGTYNVIAVIYGKEQFIEKSLKVEVKIEGKFTKLPNIFSPNNDGSNDEFFVEHSRIEEFQLNIFNQNQELIYTTNDKNFKWTGIDARGNTVPEGNYVYVIIAKDKAGNVINKYEKLSITR